MNIYQHFRRQLLPKKERKLVSRRILVDRTYDYNGIIFNGESSYFMQKFVFFYAFSEQVIVPNRKLVTY